MSALEGEALKAVIITTIVVVHPSVAFVMRLFASSALQLLLLS